jgi:hypothetical protein
MNLKLALLAGKILYFFVRFFKARCDQGEVSEWLKEHAWKVCIPERVSRVRIPPSPPEFATNGMHVQFAQ